MLSKNETAHLTYFRNSLADSIRATPDERVFDNAIQIYLSQIEGELTLHSEDVKLLSKRNSNDRPPLLNHHLTKRLDAVWAPYVWRLKPEHCQMRNGLPKWLTPLCIPVFIEESGVVLPDAMSTPWINRLLLMPVYPERLAVGTTESQDRYLASAQYNENTVTCLLDALKYCEDLYFTVCKTAPSNAQFTEHGYVLEDYGFLYAPDTRTSIVAPLIALYDACLRDSRVGGPFSAIANGIAGEGSNTALAEKYSSHLGHNDLQHPLSASQRVAMLEAQQSVALTLQGPPGTGKTAFATNLVCNEEVVQSLRSGRPTACILAPTNQAVSRALDLLFTNSRWTSATKSLAIQFSSGNDQDAKGDFHKLSFVQLNGIETHPLLREDFLPIALNDFISNASRHFNKQFTHSDLDSVASLLEAELKDKVTSFKNSYLANERIEAINRAIKIISNCTEKDTFLVWKTNLEETTRRQKNVHAKLELVIKHWIRFRDTSSVWLDVVASLPGIGDISLANRNINFFKKFEFGLGNIDYSDISLINSILKRIWHLSSTQLEVSIKTEQEANELLDEIMEIESISYIPDVVNCGMKSEEKIDRIRADIFSTAIRLKEANWIRKRVKDVHLFKGSNTAEPGKKELILSALLEYFVAIGTTLHSAPKVLSEISNGALRPYWEFFSLVIVDESGQVTPDIGITASHFGEKLVSLGDHMQIEPIWNLSASTDSGNALQAGLIQNPNEWMSLKATGITSSSGNLARYMSGVSNSRTLKEQFRSKPQIVNFLNDLCYQQSLIPMRSEASTLSFGICNILGMTDTSGGSKYNSSEAAAVALIVHQYISQWAETYQIEQKELSVGIVTPFVRQVEEINKFLREWGVSGCQVGTTHSFQGSEFDIVLFSPVEQCTVENRPFFDINKNMINVAVSRTKELCIIVGDVGSWKTGTLRATSYLLPYICTSEAIEVNIPLTMKSTFRALGGNATNHYKSLSQRDFGENLKKFLQKCNGLTLISCTGLSIDWINYSGILKSLEALINSSGNVIFLINTNRVEHENGASINKLIATLETSGANVFESNLIVDNYIWSERTLQFSIAGLFSGDSYNSFCELENIELLSLIERVPEDIKAKISNHLNIKG